MQQRPDWKPDRLALPLQTESARRRHLQREMRAGTHCASRPARLPARGNSRTAHSKSPTPQRTSLRPGEPRARRPHLVRASDHEVEVEWEVPPTAAEYEVTVQQLGQPRWLWPRVSRLEIELEWLVMVAADVTHYTNATRAEAAAHGGKGGGLVPTGTRKVTIEAPPGSEQQQQVPVSAAPALPPGLAGPAAANAKPKPPGL